MPRAHEALKTVKGVTAWDDLGWASNYFRALWGP